VEGLCDGVCVGSAETGYFVVSGTCMVQSVHSALHYFCGQTYLLCVEERTVKICPIIRKTPSTSCNILVVKNGFDHGRCTQPVASTGKEEEAVFLVLLGGVVDGQVSNMAEVIPLAIVG
jgi:hypothetical protein